MALSARDKMIKFMTDNGYVLDPAYTVHQRVHRGGIYYDYADVQDPYAFKKATGFGGEWVVQLDYKNKGDGWSYRQTTGNALKGVTVNYRDAAGEVVKFDGKALGSWHSLAHLAPKNNWRVQSVLFDLLDNNVDAGEPDKDATLVERAQKMLKDLDVSMWLLMEQVHKNSVAEQERARQARLEQEARDRPLPITVPQPEKYTSEYYAEGNWHSIASKLKSAADKVKDANGTSDLPQLVAEVHQALKGVIDVLIPEARTQLITEIGNIAAERQLVNA